MQSLNFHFKKFIQEKELKASILMEKAVSNNIKHIPKIEIFLKISLKKESNLMAAGRSYQ